MERLHYMRIKTIIFIMTFFISWMVYNFYMMYYVVDNAVITMTDLTQEQNDILKNELELNQFSSLNIISVSHSTTWGNDIPRYFRFKIIISEKQKSDFLSYIENSDNLYYIDSISDNEFEISYSTIGGSKVEEFVRKEGVFKSFRGIYLIGLSVIILLNSLIFVPYKKIYSHFSI